MYTNGIRRRITRCAFVVYLFFFCSRDSPVKRVYETHLTVFFMCTHYPYVLLHVKWGEKTLYTHVVYIKYYSRTTRVKWLRQRERERMRGKRKDGGRENKSNRKIKSELETSDFILFCLLANRVRKKKVNKINETSFEWSGQFRPSPSFRVCTYAHEYCNGISIVIPSDWW